MNPEIRNRMLKIQMIERKDLIYKGKSYAKNKYNVVVNNETCIIEDSSRNENGDVELMLRKPNNKLFFIEGSQEHIDNVISNVVLKQFEPQEEQPKEHPDAMSIGEGVLWYIIAMAVSSIFKGNWIAWIIITIIFINWYKKKPKFKK